MKFRLLATVAAIGFAGVFGIPQASQAQTAPDQQAQAAPAPAAPAPAAAAPAAPASNAMSTPSMGGTITANPNPFNIDLGPILGKTYFTGQLTGLGFIQSNHTPVDGAYVVPGIGGGALNPPTLPNGFVGNTGSELDLSNGMAEVQKTDGMFQYYAQAGIYSLPVVGVPYLNSVHANSSLYGPVPIVYGKFVPFDNFSVEIGKLPTLIGQEGTFTFQNLNIERGLLWNQENVIARGIQGNYTIGPVALAASLNDGFYSDDFSYITGSAVWTVDSADTIVLAGGGNTRNVNVLQKSPLTGLPTTNFATPLPIANEQQVDLSWTWTGGPWSINPYVQYTHIPSDNVLPGFAFNSASTYGAALLVGYTFDPATMLAGMSLGGFSLNGRAEYINSTGHATLSVAPFTVAANPLGYGANSKAWELTVTPTYQYKVFYARTELSYISASDVNKLGNAGFGLSGTSTTQFRALLEAGLAF